MQLVHLILHFVLPSTVILVAVDLSLPVKIQVLHLRLQGFNFSFHFPLLADDMSVQPLLPLERIRELFSVDLRRIKLHVVEFHCIKFDTDRLLLQVKGLDVVDLSLQVLCLPLLLNEVRLHPLMQS